jgi:hypothetical protein
MMFDLNNGAGCCTTLKEVSHSNRSDNGSILEYDTFTVHGADNIGRSPPISPVPTFLNADAENEMKASKPTPLILAIEKQDWEFTLHIIETGQSNDCPFFNLGVYTSLKGIDSKMQSRTWVDTKDWWGKTTAQRLPIHSAVMNGAPIKIVEKLLALNPNGIRSTDLDGNLPLHLCFRHASSDSVAAFLLEAFPEAVSVKNKAGKKPVDYAKADAGEIIQLCVDQTNLAAKREEARLCQALESEKSRLTEILAQLSEIRGELDHLRRIKTEGNDIVPHKTNTTIAREECIYSEDHPDRVEVVASQKRKKLINSKLRLRWMRKKVDAAHD